MDDKTFTPISGAASETAEPADITTPSNDQTASKPPRPVRDSSTSSLRNLTTKNLQSKRTTSAANSPNPSREASPVRPNPKTTTATRSFQGPGRPRKNSSQDVSPARSASSSTNPPSAAATQRALSAASIPALHPVLSEPTIRAPVPQKLTTNPEIKETPRWPISPRLRSPPPVNKPSILSPRKLEQEIPPINVQRSAQSVEKQEGKQGTSDGEVEESLSIPGMRTPARGASGASSTLETVQEISQPNTPSPGVDGALEKFGDGSRVTESDYSLDSASYASNSSIKTIRPAKSNPNANESGSESGGKGEIKMRATSAAPSTTLRPLNGATTKSFGTGAGRGKPSGEGSTRNMTVETETVSSIPQVAVGVGGGAGNNGSIRTRPSTETIRPKKDKKKTARKAPSVTSGTGEQHHLSKRRSHHHYHPTREEVTNDTDSQSPEIPYGQGPYSLSSSSTTNSDRSDMVELRRPSLTLQNVGTLLTRVRPASSKADIFEAKVASAVDDANSSDSEETFVYESNPPDANDRPRRYHSRTPSATSMASQVDHRNGSRTLLDGHHSVAMKKSMKFANSNTFNPNIQDTMIEDDGKGTARSNMGTGRGTTHHHHAGGRWNRNGGNGHPSLFDNESPFPNAAKSKIAGNSPRHSSSRPTSPRVTNMRMAGNGRRNSPISSHYDLDDGADDEQTPLIGTIRSSRSGRTRRQNGSLRHVEHQAYLEGRSILARFAGCLVLSVMILFVVTGAVGFMFATTQPLQGVKVQALKNVLVSEQDVILDLKVQARNPNLVAVTIDSTDLVVFAKSKYAGTDSEWWKHPTISLRRALRRRDDDPDDPPLGDDPNTNPNFEIGKVSEFASPLTFEGSPFRNALSSSLGQIRIKHPGNDTLPAGSERWGRVLQHEFDLIVRGTLKYTLPLSGKWKSIGVEGRVTVKPNAADQDPDTVHIIERI